MRQLGILVIHNRYQQAGGEDAVVEAEVELLRLAGHRVVPFIRDNATITRYNPLQKAALSVNTTWNQETYSTLRRIIERESPDLAHCHNLVPLVSPSAYHACASLGVPVVQTLHNYRLLCPSGTMFADRQVCSACRHNPMRAVLRGCYRDSHLQSAAIALMLAAHRITGTWNRKVDAYIAVSQSSGDCFVAAGLPPSRVHVKPNFLLRDPGQRPGSGGYAFFAGRLSAEKGALEMLEAWRPLPHIPLRIAGTGPLYPETCAALRRHNAGQVRLLGQLSPAEVRTQLSDARFLVFPSRWYEPFGMSLLEAAALGVPAIAARIGGVPEIVVDGQTGLLFDPDNFEELTYKANWAWTHPRAMEAMGQAARALYRRKYTAEKNYDRLMNIYQSVLPN